jgi:hypothetical protein
MTNIKKYFIYPKINYLFDHIYVNSRSKKKKTSIVNIFSYLLLKIATIKIVYFKNTRRNKSNNIYRYILIEKYDQSKSNDNTLN